MEGSKSLEGPKVNIALGDWRLANRRLRRSAGFTISAVMMLGIGIAVLVTAFALVSAVRFYPLPYPAAGRLVVTDFILRDPSCGERCVRPPSREEIQVISTSAPFDAVGVLIPAQETALMAAGAATLEGAAVDLGAYRMLDLRTAIGRRLTVQDYAADAPRVMVLGWNTWRDLFGSDSNIVGRDVRLGDALVTVVGVLAADASLGRPLFSLNANLAQYVRPARPSDAPAISNGTVIARLRPVISPEQAALQVASALPRPPTSPSPMDVPQWDVRVRSFRTVLEKQYRSTFVIILGGACLVLATIWINLAGLILVRTQSRTPEMGVRMALGGTRAAVVQLIVIENIVLAVCGTVTGILLAQFGVAATKLMPVGVLPFWAPVEFDWRGLALAIVLMLVTACALTIAALSVMSSNALASAQRDRFSANRGRVVARQLFVSAQIAVSITLLAAGGSLAVVLFAAEMRSIGMRKHAMLFVLLSPTRSKSDSAALAPSIAGILYGISRVPGVQSVAARTMAIESASNAGTRSRRAGGENPTITVIVNGGEQASTIRSPSAIDVTPTYFATLGMTLEYGRLFDATDAAADPVTIIDLPTAERLFGVRDPVGRQLRLRSQDPDSPLLRVVGVVAPEINNALTVQQEFAPTIYRCACQFPGRPTSFLIQVRGGYGNVAAIRRSLRETAPFLPVHTILTVEQSIGLRLWAARFNVALLVGFALLAAGVAITGLYSASSQLVAERKREYALRAALGATPFDIARGVTLSTARVAGIGLIVGLIVTAAAVPVVRSILPQAEPMSAEMFGLLAVFVVLALGIGAMYPARTAARAQPADLLRSD
jgi:putative ABC transport system permease protein